MVMHLFSTAYVGDGEILGFKVLYNPILVLKKVSKVYSFFFLSE